MRNRGGEEEMRVTSLDARSARNKMGWGNIHTVLHLHLSYDFSLHGYIDDEKCRRVTVFF